MQEINEELLIRYCSGDITGQERIVVENWINRSEENLEVAKQIYYLYFATESLHTMKDVDSQAALKKVKRKLFSKKVSLFWSRMQRIVAILFIPLLSGTLYLLLNSGMQGNDYIEIRTNHGIVTSLVLPDSSVVWLNSESYLRYPVKFKGDIRSVTLIGEGYFNVMKDGKKKFIVSTLDNTQIEVHGTEFNIEAYRKDDKITTTLVSGKISLAYLSENKQPQKILMIPNQKATVDCESGKISLITTDIASDIAWKDGKILFNDTPLMDALKILSKRFGVEFIIKNESVKNNRFTGSFVHQRLEKILQHFEVSSGIKSKYVNVKEGEVPDTEKTIIEIY